MDSDSVLERLDAAAENLLRQFVAAREGDGESEAIEVHFAGGVMLMGGGGHGEVSQAAIDDLIQLGLLRIVRRTSKGGRVLDLSTEARPFYQWLLRERGQAIDQVADEALRLVDGAAFAARQPAAAQQLEAAFDLLRSGRTEQHDLATIGNKLRGAITDVTQVSARLPTPIENIKEATKSARRSAEERGDAAVLALIDLAVAVVELDHAVTHVRDEVHQERPPADPAAVRQAAFLTAVVCYELDQRPIAASGGTRRR